jgi:uncharacterized membrane protein
MPLAVLLIVTSLVRLLGFLGVDALDSWQVAVRGGLAAMFTLTALAHFVPGMRNDLIAMVPPALPRPDLLVTVTGVLEFAGAAGLLIPATARAAAICLGLLMLVMFPANVSAARRGLTLRGKPVSGLVRRSAEQIVYLAAAVIAAL